MLQTIVVLVNKARKSTTQIILLQNHTVTISFCSTGLCFGQLALIQDSYNVVNSLEDAILKSHTSSDLTLGAEFDLSHMITYVKVRNSYMTTTLVTSVTKTHLTIRNYFKLTSFRKFFDGEKYKLSLNQEICLTI